MEVGNIALTGMRFAGAVSATESAGIQLGVGEGVTEGIDFVQQQMVLGKNYQIVAREKS